MARAMADGRPTHRALRRRRPRTGHTPLHASPAPSVEVRHATLHDLDEVTRLRLALQEEELALEPRARDDAPPPAVARARFAAQLQSPAETTLLAITLAEREVVGVLRCTVSRSAAAQRTPYAFLASAYVAPSHRRRGVLRALVEAADRWCEVRGLTDMRLYCLANNAVALGAWERLGFIADAGRRPRTAARR